MCHKDWFSLVHKQHTQTQWRAAMKQLWFENYHHMRKLGKTIQLKSSISVKLGTIVGEWMIVAKKWVKISYFLQVIGTVCQNGHLTLTYAYLFSHLWFSFATTRKAYENELGYIILYNYPFKSTDIHFNWANWFLWVASI